MKPVTGNRYEIKEGYVIGHTLKGQQFIIDIEDLEIVKPFTWHLDKEGYVSTAKTDPITKERHFYKLHRFVLGLERNDGKIVDHINRDKSDNRRNNLRLVTTQQNSFNQGKGRCNKSGVVGVFYRKREGKTPKWIASINVDKKTIQLGHFDRMEDAIKARLDAERKYYGEYRYHDESESSLLFCNERR